MTASRRYLPVSLACLVTLSAASAAMAAGGSALDPYASVSAPTSLKGSGKNDKGKKAHHVPIMKKAAAEEKIVQDESTQSQTYVKLPGGGKSKHVKEKEVSVAAEPKAKKGLGLHLPTFSKAAAPAAAPKTSKSSDLAPVPKTSKASDLAPTAKTTKVSDVAPAAAPAPKEQKAPKVSAQGDDSVMGGIKTIGEGYSKTFKAASHGVVTSTKAASDAVVAGSKKMGSGIKSGAKASGDALKKGADLVSHGFKATGEKIKDTTAPLTEKLAKAPAPAKAKIAKAEKADKVDKADPADKPEVAKAEKTGKQSLGAKLAHLPKPKLPKIGMPFRGGKKKDAVVVDKQAGANELGTPAAEPDKDVAAAPKPVLQKPIGKYTPIVDDPPTMVQAPDIPKIKEPKPDKVKGQKSSLAAMPGNVSKKIGKLWPFGHKPAANATDVAGKQTQPPM